MEHNTSTLPPPEAPAGFLHVGPVSDFVPGKTISESCNEQKESLRNDPSNESESAVKIPAGCPGALPEGSEHLIKVVEIPQPEGRYPPQKRVAVSHFHGKWYAFLNICPHQGSALSRGKMTDIEDMGIVWGAGVVCSLHGWIFDATTGRSDSTRFVIDTFDIKEIDGHIFVSLQPKNSNVAGPRRDFGGREMN